MHYYAHHLGDYAKDTGHLSLTEHGAFRMLLDHYYSTETPLPLRMESLYRICRAKSKVERQAVETVIHEFFVQQENGYFNSRVENEIGKNNDRIEKARKSGILSGLARRTGKSANERSTTVANPLPIRSNETATPNNHYPLTNVLLEKEPKAESKNPRLSSKRQAIEADIRQADEIDIPEELNTQTFRDSWDDWCLHRAELYRRTPAKRWSGQAARNTLAECSRRGADASIEAITSAIANGWQGLVWDRGNSGNRRPEQTVQHGPDTTTEFGF